MARGKVRADAHIADNKAINYVKQKLPAEWVVRELSPDYGLDLDVELFQREDEQFVTLGEHLFFQVKGTECAKYRDIPIKSSKGILAEKHLCFSLDTDLLKLVERSGNAASVLLVVVDLVLQNAYFVCLNDYIDCVLCSDNQWHEQMRKTTYIPCQNRLEQTERLCWYGIRGKLLSFFCEAKAKESIMLYWDDATKYISHVINYAKKIQNSDVWRAEEMGFGFLEPVRIYAQDLAQNGYLTCLENAFSDAKENERYDSGYFMELTPMQARQIMSCRRLFEAIDTANAMFYDDLKPLFVPSEYHAYLTLWRKEDEEAAEM